MRLVWLGRSAGTYVVPDGHDEDHGNPEGVVHLLEAADLLEAVAVVEHIEHGGAELGGDLAAVGHALPRRRRDLDLAAVLDEVLGELVLLEAGDDAAAENDVSVSVCPGRQRKVAPQGVTHVNLRLVSSVLPLP